MSKLIAGRWRELLKMLPAVTDGNDPEAVHDARVASRRLRAAMDAATGAFPERWYRSLHKDAKAITKALGSVRDYDGLLEKLAVDEASSDAAYRLGIRHLKAGISRERRKARSVMNKRLGRYETRRFRKEIRTRFPRKPGKQPPGQGKKGRDNQVSFEVAARVFIGARAADLFAFETTLQETDAAETFHDARIAVKRLRYALELFPAVIPGDGEQLIEALKGMQEMLGDLHDLDVRIQRVSGGIDRLRLSPRAKDIRLLESLLAVHDGDRQSRADLRCKVVDRWRDLMDSGLEDRLASISAPAPSG